MATKPPTRCVQQVCRDSHTPYGYGLDLVQIDQIKGPRAGQLRAAEPTAEPLLKKQPAHV